MSIEETKYWNTELENGPGFDSDIQTSFSQFSRIFQDPWLPIMLLRIVDLLAGEDA